MAAFMSNDPETSRDQTRSKPIEGPESKAGKAIEEGRRERKGRRGEQRFYVRGSFIDDTDEEEVPDSSATGSDPTAAVRNCGVLTYRAQSGVPIACSSGF